MAYDYYHGYRWLDRQGTTPRYPFGYGLSYTTFQYSNLVAPATVAADGTLTVTVDVKNTGPVTGQRGGAALRRLRRHRGGRRLGPAEEGAQGLRPPGDHRAGRDQDRHHHRRRRRTWPTGTPAPEAYVVEKMAHQLYVGPSSDATDANMQKTTFTVQ